MFQSRKIVLVPFPFTDLSAEKVRPAVIVSSPRYAHDTVTVVFVSSVLPSKLLPTDLIIDSHSRSFNKTGLKQTSLIRVHKLATLDARIILGEIGELSLADYRQLQHKLKLLFDLK